MLTRVRQHVEKADPIVPDPDSPQGRPRGNQKFKKAPRDRQTWANKPPKLSSTIYSSTLNLEFT